jgi:predicted flap endonuclease-1-like 5' DNA nuclease
VLGGLLAWILCKPLPALGEIKAGMEELDATPAAKAETAAAPVAPAAVTPAPAAAAAPAAEVKSDTLLEGEEELAHRKGSWSYQAEPAPEPAKAPKAKASKAKAPKAKAKAKPKAPAAEAPAPAGVTAGAKPATLKAARGGKADNLKEIKGVGPKMEAMLHGMGFYHFDQIAAWTAAEVAWVDENLTGFKGRVSRDNWVDQAKILASGGETEFSKRVEDGDVY